MYVKIVDNRYNSFDANKCTAKAISRESSTMQVHPNQLNFRLLISTFSRLVLS